LAIVNLLAITSRVTRRAGKAFGLPQVSVSVNAWLELVQIGAERAKAGAGRASFWLELARIG